MSFEMKPVESSQIHSIGFDSESNRLHIRFRSKKAENGQGSLYHYPCTPDQHNDFMASESKGTWFGQFKNAKDEDGVPLHPHTKVVEKKENE